MRLIGLTFNAVIVGCDLEGFASTKEEQVHEVRRWARRYGHEVIAMYDAHQPGLLQRTRTALTEGSVKAVVIPSEVLADWVWLPDSLSSPPYTGRVIAADTNKTVSIRSRQVEALTRWNEAHDVPIWWAEDNWRRLQPAAIERMKEGRRRKHEQGGYAYGAPPFGWVAVEGGLAPDPREQETRTRAIQLRDQGLPLRVICERLDGEGHRTRSGRPWSSGTLSRILDRPPPPAESIVDLRIAPWPRQRDGSRGRGRVKFLFRRSSGDDRAGGGAPPR